MNEKNLLQIYKTCYPDIARYIMNRGGTAEEVEEAFHAALSAMLSQIEKGTIINDHGAYLFRSAWYSFLSEKRHGTKTDTPPPSGNGSNEGPDDDDLSASIPIGGSKDPIEPGPGPDNLAHRKMLVEAAENIISELSQAQQNILNLSFDPELNLDDEQIGQNLGLSPDYVRLARFRAMKVLRERMYNRGFSSL
jgi:RNA polymerase sigma factor (sigma-70 family)